MAEQTILQSDGEVIKEKAKKILSVLDGLSYNYSGLVLDEVKSQIRSNSIYYSERQKKADLGVNYKV
jgi:hypothetical protein